jgi:hypothetical protein
LAKNTGNRTLGHPAVTRAERGAAGHPHGWRARAAPRHGPQTGHGPASATTRASSTPDHDGGGVLAYAGASLPVLLLFSLGGWSFDPAINSEAVAEQIVAMIVGSIGLIVAVPITTTLAALIASQLPAEALADEHETAHQQ